MIGEKAAEMVAADHGVRLADFVGSVPSAIGPDEGLSSIVARGVFALAPTDAHTKCGQCPKRGGKARALHPKNEGCQEPALWSGREALSSSGQCRRPPRTAHPQVCQNGAAECGDARPGAPAWNSHGRRVHRPASVERLVLVAAPVANGARRAEPSWTGSGRTRLARDVEGKLWRRLIVLRDVRVRLPDRNESKRKGEQTCAICAHDPL
jgi:hypothetical protein